MIKKIITLMCLLLVFAACTGTVETKETITIGVAIPLSGPVAIAGDTERAVIDFAVAEINSAGGINGKAVNIIYEDTKCDPKEALTAAKKLIDVDNVELILGGSCSSATLSMAEYAAENDVLLFASLANSFELANYPFVLRNTISTAQEGSLLATLVSNKRIAILSQDDAYAKSLHDALVKHADSTVVYDETFSSQEQDFRTNVAKIKEANPDAVFVFSLPGAGGAQFVKQLDELGVDVQVYASQIPGTEEFKELAGDAAEGIIYTDAPVAEESEKLTELLTYFEEQGISPVTQHTVAARYDSVYVLKDAILICDLDTLCIEKHIKSKTFNGLIGRHSFDANGDVVGVLPTLKKVKNGESIIFS